MMASLLISEATMEHGYPMAFNNMAIAYDFGEGVEMKDLVKAVDFAIA
jgi:hypothetical protein